MKAPPYVRKEHTLVKDDMMLEKRWKVLNLSEWTERIFAYDDVCRIKLTHMFVILAVALMMKVEERNSSVVISQNHFST